MSEPPRKGRALARFNADDAELFDQLEHDLRRQHPGLRNIRVNSATPGEIIGTGPRPQWQWYGVTFYADGE